VCPLSNLALGVVTDLRHHNFAVLLRAGVAVTINSDDPAYFGGYIGDNYRRTAEAQDLSLAELVLCAEHAARAAFVSAAVKQSLLAAIRAAAN
jgi:adenine deaminase